MQIQNWIHTSFPIVFFFQELLFIVRVMKTNLMHYLSSVNFINQPLYVSGIFVAHLQEVYYIYIYIEQLLRIVFFN